MLTITKAITAVGTRMEFSETMVVIASAMASW
jgi:hypothetical protein